MSRRDVRYRCFCCCKEARQKDRQKAEQTRCLSDGGSGARREGDTTVAQYPDYARQVCFHPNVSTMRSVVGMTPNASKKVSQWLKKLQ